MKILLTSLFLFSCSLLRKEPPFRPESWGIQLQAYEENESLKNIQTSNFDLWVLDSDDFRSSSIKMLKKKDKKLISYMSIGEAEGYRSYFKNLSPKLLGKENPHWKDNYNVNFWEKDWQNVFIGDDKNSYVNKVIDLGFDGVFLDVVDAFERYPDKKEKAQAMADFIIRLSQAARKRKVDFIIIMQNGLSIRRFLDDPAKLLKAISGVNAENVYQERSAELLEDIAFYRQAKKFVLGLEYLNDSPLREEYFSFAHAHGMIPLSSDVALKGDLKYPGK